MEEIFYAFFLVDIGFIGYLAGKELGAITYNIMHSYIIPFTIAIIIWYINFTNYNDLIIIWLAHIGFDRALGYGLKYSTGFSYTHLGIIKKLW